jgi:hypothetical protein
MKATSGAVAASRQAFRATEILRAGAYKYRTGNPHFLAVFSTISRALWVSSLSATMTLTDQLGSAINCNIERNVSATCERRNVQIHISIETPHETMNIAITPDHLLVEWPIFQIDVIRHGPCPVDGAADRRKPPEPGDGSGSGRPMYQYFHDFAGPIATIVAAVAAISVTAYFARHQKNIASNQAFLAREKLRFDLFEKRYEIFDSIFDFYNAMALWGGTPEQITARTRFFRSYQASPFLFKRSRELQAYSRTSMMQEIR